MQPLFITSTGTDVGKTLVTTSLCWQLRQKGKHVTALKPVISGYNEADKDSDSALILRSCGLQPEPKLMETISPWRYPQLLAPAMAAERTGHHINMNSLLSFCRDHVALQNDALIIEGAGGVMVPLTKQHTVLDWIAELEWPTLLVAGSYLGAISHTLTALEVMRGRNITVRAVVVSESVHSTVLLDDAVASLGHYVPKDIPILKIPRMRPQAELWKYTPSIDWVMEEKQS